MKNERQEKTRQDEREEKRRQDKKRRQDNTKEKRREEKRREGKGREEKIKRDTMRCVRGCVVLTFPVFCYSKLPDTRIILNFQNYHFTKNENVFFSCNFCLC